MEDQASTPGTAVVLESGYILTMADAVNHFEPAYAIVQSWHDVSHAGTFRFCPEQPCHALHFQRRPC